MSSLLTNADYVAWLQQIKRRISRARVGVALAANRELIRFYWDLGGMISVKQSESQWGDKVIPQLSRDLQRDFPDLKGLSASNLKYCLRFFQFYCGAETEIISSNTDISPFSQQPVDQIPWGHNILIFTKCGSLEEAGFYIGQTLEQGWSRDVLAMQLKSNLYMRTGKAITNFSRTLPSPQSDLAQRNAQRPLYFRFYGND